MFDNQKTFFAESCFNYMWLEMIGDSFQINIHHKSTRMFSSNWQDSFSSYVKIKNYPDFVLSAVCKMIHHSSPPAHDYNIKHKKMAFLFFQSISSMLSLSLRSRRNACDIDPSYVKALKGVTNA